MSIEVNPMEVAAMEAKMEPVKAWLIYFEDPDMSTEVFTGEGAMPAARRRFDAISVNYNCTLFLSEATAAEIVHSMVDACWKMKRLYK